MNNLTHNLYKHSKRENYYPRTKIVAGILLNVSNPAELDTCLESIHPIVDEVFLLVNQYLKKQDKKRIQDSFHHWQRIHNNSQCLFDGVTLLGGFQEQCSPSYLDLFSLTQEYIQQFNTECFPDYYQVNHSFLLKSIYLFFSSCFILPENQHITSFIFDYLNFWDVNASYIMIIEPSWVVSFPKQQQQQQRRRQQSKKKKLSLSLSLHHPLFEKNQFIKDQYSVLFYPWQPPQRKNKKNKTYLESSSSSSSSSSYLSTLTPSPLILLTKLKFSPLQFIESLSDLPPKQEKQQQQPPQPLQPPQPTSPTAISSGVVPFLSSEHPPFSFSSSSSSSASDATSVATSTFLSSSSSYLPSQTHTQNQQKNFLSSPQKKKKEFPFQLSEQQQELQFLGPPPGFEKKQEEKNFQRQKRKKEKEEEGDEELPLTNWFCVKGQPYSNMLYNMNDSEIIPTIHWHITQKKYKKLLSILSSSIVCRDTHPDQWFFHYVKGFCLIKTDEFEIAQPVLLQSLARRPDRIEPLFLLIYELKKRKLFKKSIVLIKQLCETKTFHNQNQFRPFEKIPYEMGAYTYLLFYEICLLLGYDTQHLLKECKELCISEMCEKLKFMTIPMPRTIKAFAQTQQSEYVEHLPLSISVSSLCNNNGLVSNLPKEYWKWQSYVLTNPSMLVLTHDQLSQLSFLSFLSFHNCCYYSSSASSSSPSSSSSKKDVEIQKHHLFSHYFSSIPFPFLNHSRSSSQNPSHVSSSPFPNQKTKNKCKNKDPQEQKFILIGATLCNYIRDEKTGFKKLLVDTSTSTGTSTFHSNNSNIKDIGMDRNENKNNDQDQKNQYQFQRFESIPILQIYCYHSLKLLYEYPIQYDAGGGSEKRQQIRKISHIRQFKLYYIENRLWCLFHANSPSQMIFGEIISSSSSSSSSSFYSSNNNNNNQWISKNNKIKMRTVASFSVMTSTKKNKSKKAKTEKKKQINNNNNYQNNNSDEKQWLLLEYFCISSETSRFFLPSSSSSSSSIHNHTHNNNDYDDENGASLIQTESKKSIYSTPYVFNFLYSAFPFQTISYLLDLEESNCQLESIPNEYASQKVGPFINFDFAPRNCCGPIKWLYRNPKISSPVSASSTTTRETEKEIKKKTQPEIQQEQEQIQQEQEATNRFGDNFNNLLHDEKENYEKKKENQNYHNSNNDNDNSNHSFSSGWLCIACEKIDEYNSESKIQNVKKIKKTFHFHRFLFFDSHYKLIKISKPFFFKEKKQYEFVSSIIPYYSGILIGITFLHKSSFLYYMDSNLINKLLLNVNLQSYYTLQTHLYSQ